ncbi:MAG: nuclear transport factor 2 family protein [Terracidiphilus sp.]
MKRAFPLLALLLLCAAPAAPQTNSSRATLPSGAQAQSAQPQVAAIRAVIAAQVAAWNRGSIPAFMQAYEDSPDTTFIGLTLRKGFQPIRERYMLSYTTPEQMGTLTFSDLDVRLLPSSCGQAEYAVVTGRFHLDRKAKGEAKKDDGIFSLVWRKGPNGWKIIVDHTS